MIARTRQPLVLDPPNIARFSQRPELSNDLSQSIFLFFIQSDPLFWSRVWTHKHTFTPKFLQLRVANPVALEIVNVPSGISRG